mmetsp:Transcript_9291/g.25870  ORF Transcript_9291/g.25870 Transcript_9291/m.25870 type:complete len:222 (-) Transcript_9291:201-866(-)
MGGLDRARQRGPLFSGFRPGFFPPRAAGPPRAPIGGRIWCMPTAAGAAGGARGALPEPRRVPRPFRALAQPRRRTWRGCCVLLLRRGGCRCGIGRLALGRARAGAAGDWLPAVCQRPLRRTRAHGRGRGNSVRSHGHNINLGNIGRISAVKSDAIRAVAAATTAAAASAAARLHVVVVVGGMCLLGGCGAGGGCFLGRRGSGGATRAQLVAKSRARVGRVG